VNIGICTWAFRKSASGRRAPDELAFLASKAGFSSIEGAYSQRGAISIAQSPCAEMAIPIRSLATLELHRFTLLSDKPEIRSQGQKTIKDMIRCANSWRIPSISISPGKINNDIDLEIRLEQLISDLLPYQVLASDLGVTLALENVPGHILQFRRVMKNVLDALPDLKLCLDVGNTLVDPPVSAWVKAFSDKIVKLHLSDGVLVNGTWVVRFPGEGKMNWNEVKNCFSGMDNAEVFLEMPWDGQSEETQYLSNLYATISTLCRG